MHMFAGSQAKGIRMGGYIEKGLLDASKLQARHDELVIEMEARGYNHKSPIDVDLCASMANQYGITEVDVEDNLDDLDRRCETCRRNIHEFRSSTSSPS